MFLCWLALGMVLGKATSPEVRRMWRWKLHKWIDGRDHNGAAVQEYIERRNGT